MEQSPCFSWEWDRNMLYRILKHIVIGITSETGGGL